jgi:RNA recognition motif-containing protein
MENSKRKIFIGGLPANITETQLKDQFIKYGNVSPQFCVIAVNIATSLPFIVLENPK